jgi:hypothetical protein
MTNPAPAPPKWFGLFLLAYIINYIWGLLLVFNYLKLTWNVLHLSHDGRHTIPHIGLFNLDIIYTILQTGYFSIVLFLLLRQQRWGWFLAVGGAVAFLITRVAQLDIGVRSPALIGDDWFGFILPMAIQAAFALYLLRSGTTLFFGVTGRTRKNTIIVGVAVALLVTITGRIIYRA